MVFLRVPEGATIHTDDIILHYLNPDRHEVVIEIMDTFGGHNLTTDKALQQQLLAEGTKLIQVTLKPTGLTTTPSNHTSRLTPYQEHPISVYALGLLLSGWIILAIVAHIMYKYIQKVQGKLDSLLFVSPHFTHQSATIPLVSSNPFQE